MFDDDPIGKCSFEMTEVCAFPPSDFEFSPSALAWEHPCWVCADIVLRPLTTASREKFVYGVKFPHRWDAFTKASWNKQFWAAFAPRLQKLSGPYRGDWSRILFECQQKLVQQLANATTLFPEPFRFIPRQQFTTVDLATVLRGNPEDFCVYLAVEKRTSQFVFLRIHSRLPVLSQSPECLWFEKRLADQLHKEDVALWFLATMRKLPKKLQPDNVQPWLDRLLSFEPQLALPTGIGKAWTEKPKIILVYGPISKVGYRGMRHFERKDISHIIRQRDVITISGTERIKWVDERSFEYDHTFYLLALDEAAAQRVERQLLHGDKIHFGLNADILGIMSRSGNIIHAINVSVDTIRHLCLAPNLDLELLGDPKYKVKLYEVRNRGEIESLLHRDEQ